MNTLQFTHDTVKMLGVNGLAIYMLMRCAEAEGLVPITHQWIFDHMPGKIGVNTVTAELRRLTSAERQIARRVKGGWRLNLENAFQLPLEYLPEGENLSQRDSRPVDVVVVESEETQKNKSTTSTNRVQNLSQRDSGTTTRTQVKALPDSGAPAEVALKAALNEFKITGRKRAQLIEDEFITAEYVRASVKFAQAENLWDNPVGMAIGRMLEHVEVDDSAPVKKVASSNYRNSFLQACEECGEVNCICEHAEDCICIECRRAHPERFCQFEIAHPAEMLSRGNMRAGWKRTCDAPLDPGQKYCARHQKESESE
jgi:hypothetical protein